MGKQPVPAEVQEALWDFQKYLSDETAPMMVCDSLELLLKCPPELVAAEIQGWVQAQFRGPAATAPVSDCLFHAVKKIHMMSEFNLIEAAALDQYLAKLGEIILGVCPDADRPLLQDNLQGLGRVESATTAAVEFLHRQAGSGGTATAAATATAAPAATTSQGGTAVGQVAVPATMPAVDPAVGEAVALGMQRLSVLLERLGQVATPGETRDSGAHAAATAAVQARSGAEFRKYVEALEERGVSVDTSQVFETLGNSLPGWNVDVPQGADAAALPGNSSVEAMHRIISEASSAEEGAQRFTEMMNAATDQANQGRLIQAVTMFDLAERIIGERKLNAEVVKAIRARAHERLDVEALLKGAEDPEKQPLIGKVLAFFPAYSPRQLLEELHGEPKRERRKAQLALLEAQGAATRAVVLDRLVACVNGDIDDPHGYLHRNLIYLLRRTHDEATEQDPHETELVVASSTLDRPWLVVRETIGVLGQLKSPEAETALRTRLQELEAALVKGQLPFDVERTLSLLDRTTSSLTRLATKNAYRTVVGHALKRSSKLGDTMARLEELAGHDLGVDPELVDHLLKALKNELPSKVLGFVVHKNNPNISHLVRALSGTPDPRVRQLFEEIRERFGEREFAADAEKALAASGVRSRGTEEQETTSLSGDVELFGLPNLLQSLADSSVTGVLALSDRDGQTVGTITLLEGKISECTHGSLTGELAFYQLFERPTAGTFLFRRKRVEPAGDTPPIEVMGALLEALRRYDEFEQARAIVPDDASLKATGARPTPCEDENDAAFMRSVWERAARGSTPETCEAAVRTDSYRVRRLYAHWVATGALQAA